MRICVISDTHGRHEELGELQGDVLIHCGDVEHMFQPDPNALDNIDDWFGRQLFERILVIGGNHDLALERRARQTKQPFQNATYLQDSAVTHNGVNFWGAPWVPDLRGHAFYANDAALMDAWSKIPENVDILITHTPQAKILDIASNGRWLGCPHLARRLETIRPRIHCFGHVHAGRGTRHNNGMTSLNAVSVNSQFEISHPPFEFEFRGARDGEPNFVNGGRQWRSLISTIGKSLRPKRAKAGPPTT